uniref:Transmembrane protein n=1 Tax=Cannabis sativa TaxID=3483 RepID=A0A803NK10_CANSA
MGSSYNSDSLDVSLFSCLGFFGFSNFSSSRWFHMLRATSVVCVRAVFSHDFVSSINYERWFYLSRWVGWVSFLLVGFALVRVKGYIGVLRAAMALVGLQYWSSKGFSGFSDLK